MIENQSKESSSKKKVGAYLSDYKLYEDENSTNNVTDIVNLQDIEYLLTQIAVCSSVKVLYILPPVTEKASVL